MTEMDMKRLIFCCLCGVLLAACVREPELDTPRPGEGEVWTSFDFGHTDFDQVRVTTRSTLGPIAESRVSNLYVFLFNSSGNRVYGHFFDNDNKRSTRAEVISANSNCWMVDNTQDASGAGQTRGTIRMKIPQLSGGTFCIVANLDTDMFNVSAEKFSYIADIDELEALAFVLNQEITSRNGMFPMTGRADGVTVAQDGIFSSTGGSLTIPLTRLDAKIDVRFRAAVGNETVVETADGETIQRVKGFTPTSWRVVNLPKGSYLFEKSVVPEGGHDADDGYFESPAVDFEEQTEDTFTYDKNGTPEEVTTTAYGFSFYMYENRPAMKKTVANDYYLRDKRLKDDTGAYDTTDGMWEYAPESGTYLVVDGEVEMDVDVSSTAQDQALTAAVTYYIHLGDIKTSMDDYKINRNTHYTYTITVKGVKNIQVEVATKTEENESGATGHVYIAKESIYTFDAHYGQRVFAFDAEFITPDDVTWYVKTPFGREGMPEKINGVEVPNGLDYKWVSFIINETDASGQYSHKNRQYHPDNVMDIMEFCEYIREQKRRFESGRTNAFRQEIDEQLRQQYPNRPDIYTRYRIYATIFVDEFYYDKDPISGEVRPTLWKEFVNQPNRTMHILCDTQYSADNESSATGSVVTIRQRSIQTTYDTSNEQLQTAWGCETIDETIGKLWFYHRNERHNTALPVTPENYGNSSLSNGLYNTARLWELTDGNGAYATKHWDDYLEYDRNNDHNLIYLKDDDELATARYTCLMRNRDNNGNGVIDASEVRWYIASIQQLTALYIGDQGISGDAQLYDRYNGYSATDTDAYGTELWRLHLISSTAWGKDGALAAYPTMLWAEEGLSTSAYKQYDNEKPGRYAVRCVRNLGMDRASETEAVKALNDINNLPEYSVQFLTPQNDPHTQNSVYKFDLTRINKKSIRYFTSRELEPGDEYSEASRTYSAFETGPLVTYTGDYESLKSMIERGESPCPEGYRTPNVREASLMSNYITAEINANWWTGKYTFVGSYYYFGTLGNNFDQANMTWYCTDHHITTSVPIENGVSVATTIRCVKDVE